MKLLISAFAPFGGRTCNTSANLLAAFKNTAPTTGFSSYTYTTLPVDFRHAWPQLRKKINKAQPDAILLMGEKQGGFLTLETLAHNSRISHRGIIPIDTKGVLTLKPMPAVLDLRKNLRLSFLSVSNDAGTYLCNFIYYKTLSALPYIPVLFLHIGALSKTEFIRREKKHQNSLRRLIRELAKAIDGAGANCTSREN